MKWSYCFIFLSILSCHFNNSKEKLDEKESDLRNYYLQVLNSKLPDDRFIVIVQNQRCSSCRFDVFTRFSKLLNADSLPKTFIMHHYDSAIVNLITNKTKIEIRIDSAGKLKDYGLDFAADLFFHIKNGKLYNRFEISNEVIDSLKKI
jgi:hypothetical protein